MAIAFLEPGHAADLAAVAALQEEHIAGSPLSRLGPRFLRQFFYDTLVRDGLIAALLYHLDDRVVALLSYTKYPGDFLSRGVRRHPIRFGWIMLRTVLAGERSAKELWWLVARCVLHRGGSAWIASPQRAAGAIEAISLVTLSQYQKHVPEGGKSRLTIRLIERLAEEARAAGIGRVLYVVSAKNAASNLVLHAMGCEFEKVTHAGQTVFWHTYVINPKPEAV